MRESVFSGLKEKRKPSKSDFKRNYFKHEKPIAEQGAKGEQGAKVEQGAKQLARRSLLLQGIDREEVDKQEDKDEGLEKKESERAVRFGTVRLLGTTFSASPNPTFVA